MKYVLVLDLILKYKNISVKELSIDSNISESYLYELVNNSKVNPTLDMLFQISYIINENVKNFFYAVSEFEIVQKKMNNLIEEKGVNDSKVKYLSEVLDRLLVLKLKGSN